ncbi:neuraminidase-like domain-containing protein, partial [Kitasatospora sp. NPDC093558]|uniref:neuraminidase-like domain-containing protein n=1 Tax=Kitasatospora sp. NPDC093558 TaxID=3155201 RepID=UPI00341CE5BC
VPADAVAGWCRIVRDNSQPVRAAIVADVTDTLKATLEPTAWQRLAQPVFDRLRARRRDALVAYTMHAVGVSSLEQLYDYFLLDPGMEPVVQTSRIRLATASVKLFIQRILLKLVPNVPPEAINAKRWEVMRRQTLWRGDREIFLHPEYWLEEEFRDQKTHLFTELESTLLEGDVSSDLVEGAFLTYLTKLDQLASLDIVASHLEDDPERKLRTLHVFGRTSGTPAAYFYRRYVHGAWTPWEPVGLDIQGDHLAPVVWHGRLRLFWVTFSTVATESTTTTVVTTSITIPPPSLTTIAQLHWSDYVNGAWSNPSSGSADPVTNQCLVSTGHTPTHSILSFTAKGTIAKDLGALVGPGHPQGSASRIPPSSTPIRVAKEAFTEEGEERGVFVSLGHPFDAAFYLQSRNSSPVPGDAPAATASPYSATGVRATLRAGDGPLTVSVERRHAEIGLSVTSTTENVPLLNPPGVYSLLEPNSDIVGPPPEVAPLIRPVFFQDNQYTLFGEPVVRERTVAEWEEWVAVPAPSGDIFHLHDILDHLAIEPARPDLHLLALKNGVNGIFPKPPLPGDGQPDWLLNDVTALAFDDVIIHPAAGTRLVELDTTRINGSGVFAPDVAPGVGLTQVLTSQTAAAAPQPVGLGIVGGSGASRAILGNVAASQLLEGS